MTLHFFLFALILSLDFSLSYFAHCINFVLLNVEELGHRNSQRGIVICKHFPSVKVQAQINKAMTLHKRT